MITAPPKSSSSRTVNSRSVCSAKSCSTAWNSWVCSAARMARAATKHGQEAVPATTSTPYARRWRPARPSACRASRNSLGARKKSLPAASRSAGHRRRRRPACRARRRRTTRRTSRTGPARRWRSRWPRRRTGPAVVEAGLGGQREAHLRPRTLAFANLGLRGDPEFGRGEAARAAARRPAPDRPPPAETPPPRCRSASRGQQPPGGRPTSPAQRPVDLQPGAHQRHDHADLGQVGGDLRVPASGSGAGRPMGRAKTSIPRPRTLSHGQRAALQQSGEHPGQQGPRAHQRELDIDQFHPDHLSPRPREWAGGGTVPRGWPG